MFKNCVVLEPYICLIDPPSTVYMSFETAATWAKYRGVSDDQIQLCGRWKSDAYKKYIRNPF